MQWWISKVVRSGQEDIAVTDLEVMDAVPLEALASEIIEQLKEHRISSEKDLQNILFNFFGVSVKGCPGIVDRVSNAIGVTA
jgi:hypothetical protein